MLPTTTHGTQNKALFNSWLAKHGALAREAASSLQPIWSQPQSRPSSFEDAQAAAKNRIKEIVGELA